MLVSPTESPAARTLGSASWRTEDFGVDFLWAAHGNWWGVQRKALKDLVASVEDGRLSKERLQWSELWRCYLIIETGERGGAAPRTMPNDTIVTLGSWGRPWTGAQLRSLTYSLMDQGVMVVWTADESETLLRVVELEIWSKKDNHHAATTRPAARANVFGERGNREYGVWLLSSLPGVGPEMAGRIWDHFGGLPVRMTCGMDELTKVKGVGKVTAKRIVDVFGGEEKA